MIEYKICEKKDLANVIKFIRKIDEDFPIPVSKKISIDEYVQKLFTNGKIFIVDHENKIIGICAGYLNDFENYKAYISILGIDANYRKNGIATSLVNKFNEEARNGNMKVLYLETHKENFSALRFYEKNGFILLKDKDANIKENVVLMRKIEENNGRY